MGYPDQPEWLRDSVAEFLLDAIRAERKNGPKVTRNMVIEESGDLGSHRAAQALRWAHGVIIGNKSGNSIERQEDGKGVHLHSRGTVISSLEDLLAAGEVDLDVWRVDRHTVNRWGSADTPQWQVKAWLSRRGPEETSLNELLARMQAQSLAVEPYPYERGWHRRALEISITDPHLGMRCFPPAAEADWTTSDAVNLYKWVVQDLLAKAAPYGPFEEVWYLLGSDLLHVDNLQHTTTSGTGQPEADAWHHTFIQAEELALWTVNRLATVAPVKVQQIPGNHARQSEFCLGRVVNAYFANDSNIEVDASPAPYKFRRFGTNLIGWEHGHSITPIRLAAIMANERREDWAVTSFREWHLGDQHRKGSSKPSSFEEQGVSVEYLPGLTPPNEWHKIKGFSWQKRAGVGFIWNYDTGQEARILSNIDSYTGRPTGEIQST